MISGTFNFMIVFQAEHKNVVLYKPDELTGKLKIRQDCLKLKKEVLYGV